MSFDCTIFLSERQGQDIINLIRFRLCSERTLQSSCTTGDDNDEDDESDIGGTSTTEADDISINDEIANNDDIYADVHGILEDHILNDDPINDVHTLFADDITNNGVRVNPETGELDGVDWTRRPSEVRFDPESDIRDWTRQDWQLLRRWMAEHDRK